MDRDEDGQSPLPSHVQWNGRADDPYLEVPSNFAPPSQPQPPTNVTFTTPGSPQKKLGMYIIS